MKWVGIGIAVLIGVIAASIIASNLVRESHTTLVLALVCSDDSDTRVSGWSLVDDAWTAEELERLEQALLDGSIEARQDAILHGFVPRIDRTPFAEAIVDIMPHRAVDWLAQSDGSEAWTATAAALLQNDDPSVRRGALEAIVATFPVEALGQFQDSAQNREHAVLAYAINGLPETTKGDPVQRAAAQKTLRTLIDQKRTDIWLRRRAAWHLRALDDGAALGLLGPAPADSENSVYLSALIAEKHLSAQAQDALIKRWLEDFEVDRRRAAALLVVLRGDDPAGLQAAERREHDAIAKRTMRLALRSLDRWPLADVDPEEYAARARTLPNGRPDPDALLLRLLAGDESGLRLLTERLRKASNDQPPWRVFFLGRVVPSWHSILTEPPPKDPAAINDRFDRLEAARLRMAETLRWDEASRQWVAETPEAEDDVPHE